MAEEVPPDQAPKRRKRRTSVSADATVRDFGPGAQVFKRYTLTRVLGRGGMGVVWLAHDDELDRQVALKFLPQQIVHDQAVLADLKRETKRSLELTHPNIVRIHDFVQDTRSACISMEFVDGETLSSLRINKRNHVFEAPDLEPLVAQWCEAMHYAHVHARIVHCDLKPANLMLNAKGLLKITDFGIARSLSDSVSKLTVAGRNSGTLVYMSPQQLNGDPASVFDDIYSMGATLYELLTGKPPFYRGQIDLQIFDKVPPSIAVRRTELGVESLFIVPLEWEDTIAACLSKDPGERPKGAFSLLNRLNLVSPLRGETPLIAPTVKEMQGPPLVPGSFGLMQDQPTDLPKPSLIKRTFHSSAESSVASEDKSAKGRVDGSHSSVEEIARLDQPTAPSGTHSGPVLFQRASQSRQRLVIAILFVLGVILIAGLWLLFPSASPNSALALPRTNVTPPATSVTPIPTPASLSTPRDEQASPVKPTATLSPSLTPHGNKRTVLPKDDLTRFRNEVAAAERAILAPQEKSTVGDRLKGMTIDGQSSYEKAVAALEEGYPSTAQSFASEVERAEGEHPLGLCLQGLIFLSQGKLDEAESAFARSSTVDPEFREAEYNLASVAFAKKDYTRARKRFEHLLSVVTSPDETLKQFLQYRIYLGVLQEGAPESAQRMLQNMRANAETPAFYYAHAAWEFRRNDAAIGKQWVDSIPFHYSHDLDLLFLKPLCDAGWLTPLPNIESTSLPSATPSAIPTPTPVPQALSLIDVALSQETDTSVAVHLNLRIGIASKPNTPNGHNIDIRVSFFDVTTTGKTVPTDARTSYRWMTSKRDWSDPTTKYLVATYVRPKTSATGKGGRKYGGYIVRLYFDGHFQDEKAAPVSLLKAFPTDTQAILLTPGVSPSASPQSPVLASVTPTPSESISPASSDTPSKTDLQGDTLSEISALEDKWAAALLLHDAEAVESFLADAYEAVTPTGRKLNKSQATQRIRDDTDKYDLVEVENIQVQVKSNTNVVATGLLRQRGKFSNGKVFERAYLFTDDWIKAEGKWLCRRSQTERTTKH